MCLRFSGTSASAPLAAAIIALALEANPKLSWRDLQHLLVQTSHRSKLISGDWRMNAAGRYYSHRFGYGLIDAGRFVLRSKDWITVPSQHSCTTSVIETTDQYADIEPNKPLILYFESDSSCTQHVEKLEHVILKLSVDFDRRGDLKISIFSPSGTESNVLDQRPNDSSKDGFDEFEFLTVHFWDEANEDGQWTVKVEDVSNKGHVGTLRLVQLILYGTAWYQYPAECKYPNVYDMESDSCFMGCPRRKYAHEFTNAISNCYPCHEGCTTCTGSEKEDCNNWKSGSGKSTLTTSSY